MFKHLLIYIVTLFICSCASIQPPKGGEKDIVAPKIKYSSPNQQSTNFTGNKISIAFDEPVDFNSLKNQLIITPPIKGDYEIKGRKNLVEIEFQEAFDSNTTYTLKFREGIKDKTEGNIIDPSESLVFSTGEYIDTIYISGMARDYLTNKLTKNILIGLYQITDTLNIKKDHPYYYTMTNDFGLYKIDNIAPGEYVVFAIEDLDKNLIYNSKKERVSYYQNNLKLYQSKDTLELFINKYNEDYPKVISTKYFEDKVDIHLNKGIVYQKTESNVNEVISENGKKITLFPKENKIDTINYVLNSTDSLKNPIIDTINIYFKSKIDTKKETAKQKNNIFPKMIEIENNLITTEIILDNIYHIDTALIWIEIDSNKKIIPTIKFDSIFNKIKINEFVSFKDTIKLMFERGSLISLSEDTLDEIKVIILKKDPTKHGTIEGVVNSKFDYFIIQLIDEKLKVNKELYNNKKFKFDYIKPGDYKIRIIEDRNNNNKWDVGVFDNKDMPEKIFFYKEKISIRANWEIQDINITVN